MINYEVFINMMNRWTPENQARLAKAKARHDLPSCAFVNAVREESYPIDEVDPALLAIASRWRRDLYWTDVGRYTTKGPRGSAVQRLYVDGARCGEAYVVADEISGECGT